MKAAANSRQARLAALLGGVVFGVGLVLSGMTEPQNVLAFLTLAQTWSPALVVVMGSAVIVATLGFALAKRRVAPYFVEQFHSPTTTSVDARLVVGATTFGVGWGLSGFCPGPAFVGAMTLDIRAVAFLLAFVLGLGLFEVAHHWFDSNTAKPRAVADG